MPFNRTSSCVAIGLFAFLLVATPMLGQGPQGMQLFAPADVSTYGGEEAPNEGYFFQWDGLYWTISAPETQLIGASTTRVVYYGPDADDSRNESTTLDTGDLQNQFSGGNRYEFGRVEGRNGWLCSIYQLNYQSQTLIYPSADVVFNDPPFGVNQHLLAGAIPLHPALYPTDNTVVERDLPTTLYNISVKEKVDTWGVELMYLHRALTGHSGGTFEFFAGARYFELNDNFRVLAGDDPGNTIVPSFLANSYWDTSADNHVIGPQVGVRWFKKQGRWTFSSEGRFMAGLNCQNFHQDASIGPNLDPGGLAGNGTTTGSGIYRPSVMGPTSSSSDTYARVFTPLVELRVEGRYQITRYFTFHAGWTGFWMDNIARANAVIDYTVPAMGIDLTRNKQDVFINGLTMGIDFNR